MTSLASLFIKKAVLPQRSFLRGDRPVQEERADINALAHQWIHPPRSVSVHSIQAGGVPAEWLEPQTAANDRVVLYLHGGGYVLCSPATHRGLTGQLARDCPARVLSVDYRLAPEYPFPAALEDALAAYRWLLDQGIAPRSIAIGGDSAGGGLTLSAAISLRETRQPLPAALFLLSPWTDLTFSGEAHRTRAGVDPIFRGSGDRSLATSYAGAHSPAEPLISPLFADLHGLPPTLIQVGDEEILLSDSTELEKALLAAGVEVQLEVWQGMWHVFQVAAPLVPESRLALRHIESFLDQTVWTKKEGTP
jgi:acetyl esterase/lipase